MNLENRSRNGRAGVTLIEMLVVLMIIGLFAALVAPRMFRKSDAARVVAAHAQINSFMTALGAYKLDTGTFPTTEQGLQALRDRPAGDDWKSYEKAIERSVIRLQGMRNADSAARAAIARVGLEDAADRAIGTYSKGMRQRAKVAGALVHDPQVLLLDEPFNGMDPRQRLAMMDLLVEMAGAGRTILFSSHILEEVERIGTEILVLVAGRLAASGDFRAIRALMTDRPHTITIRSSDDRRLATTLMADPAVFAVELKDNAVSVQTAHLSAFRRIIAGASRTAGVRLTEVVPADESLESVFDYLVRR